MSKHNSSNGMLLPLVGIGAAVFFYMSKKKKQAGESDNSTASLPSSDMNEAAMKQIEPAAAPTYSQAIEETASEDEVQEDDMNVAEPEQEDNEESEDKAAASSGSSYTPYVPASTINADRQQTTALPKIQITRKRNILENRKPLMSRSSILRQQDEFNKRQKAMRFQSDQLKKQYIGNGKPRMGVVHRPAATSVTAQTIVAKQVATQSPVTAAKAAPSTIFPLKYGMKNNPYVTELQRKLGISANGHFNSQTKRVLQRKYKVQEVNETLYKQIITGKVTVAAKKPTPKLLNKIKKILPKRKSVKRK